MLSIVGILKTRFGANNLHTVHKSSENNVKHISSLNAQEFDRRAILMRNQKESKK